MINSGIRKISLIVALVILLPLIPTGKTVSAAVGLDAPQRAELKQIIEQLETQIAKLQQANIKAVVTFQSNSVASITSVSRSAMPHVYGKAQGVEKIKLAIFNDGQSIYGPVEIRTEDGPWSHQVTTALPLGQNEFVLYINDFVYQRFTIPFEFTVAELRLDLNGKTVLTTKEVSEEEARAKCVAAYADPSQFEFKAGDTLNCYWDGEVFMTIEK